MMKIFPSRIFLFLVMSLAAQTVGVGKDESATEPAQEPAVKVVAKTLPAVVNINTESVVRRTVRNPMDSLFDEFFGHAMLAPRMIKQKVQSLGSGFFIDAAGTIITNAHVVERAAEMKISITTSAGKTYTARYIAGDPDHDLAMIKVDAPEKFSFIPVEDISRNLLGQSCLVLGNPLGYGSSVARGILSATGRSVTVGDVEYENLVQTDAAINPGNSGGPVIDISGRLVGISSVKMSFTPQGVPTQGIGFAIPASVVREKVQEFRKIERGEKLPEKPSLARKFFGLRLTEVDEKLATTSGYGEGTGAFVAEVESKSPAALAGVQPGMLVESIGRYEVHSPSAVEKLLRQIEPGDPVDFGIVWNRKTRRDNRLLQDSIRLIAR